MGVDVLSRAEWTRRAEAHHARLAAYVEPHLARRRAGEKHPVHDFLFTYYSQRPAQLLRWHPGYGVGLADAAEYDGLKGYGVAGPSVRQGARPATRLVTRAFLRERLDLVASLRDLLAATAARAPHVGCFGLHEWAMVHRADETRHDRPLRLGARGTDAVVESHRMACSHFDAYRFFTPSARPLNTLSPGRDDRSAYEQPACLHAGMDLYKHAFRLTPLVCSDLVADCFVLAWEIREVDMRAAPYDLTGLRMDRTGEEWRPLRIETPEGKREYADAQRAFADRAAPLRHRLIEECERLLTAC